MAILHKSFIDLLLLVFYVAVLLVWIQITLKWEFLTYNYSGYFAEFFSPFATFSSCHTWILYRLGLKVEPGVCHPIQKFGFRVEWRSFNMEICTIAPVFPAPFQDRMS